VTEQGKKEIGTKGTTKKETFGNWRTGDFGEPVEKVFKEPQQQQQPQQ